MQSSCDNELNGYVMAMSTVPHLCKVPAKQPDCRWNEGPVVALCPTLWMCESAAEGAALGTHSLMRGVRGVVHDGCQLG